MELIDLNRMVATACAVNLSRSSQSLQLRAVNFNQSSQSLSCRQTLSPAKKHPERFTFIQANRQSEKNLLYSKSTCSTGSSNEEWPVFFVSLRYVLYVHFCDILAVCHRCVRVTQAVTNVEPALCKVSCTHTHANRSLE